MSILVKAGESFKIPVTVRAADNGAHGAIIIKSATLVRSDNSTQSLTPSDAILREEGHAVSPGVESTVSGSPSYSSGGLTGGKNGYVITTASNHSYSPGDHIRHKTPAGPTGIYKVDTTPSSTTLKVFCAQNELDITDGDLIEKVVPESWYTSAVSGTYSNLNGLHGFVEIEIDGVTSRGNDPVVTVAINERKLTDVGPIIEQGNIKIA